MAQKVLPAEALRPLKILVDSLDYVEVLDFEQSHILGYDADSGRVSIFVEQFYRGTYKKTSDEYLHWFKISEIDPKTIALVEEPDAFGLIFFAANNMRAIHTMAYVSKEAVRHFESDRMQLRFWYKDADRTLLLKIREELIRLIHLAWDGKPPTYETDIHKPARLFINGEEVIWQEAPLPEGADED